MATLVVRFSPLQGGKYNLKLRPDAFESLSNSQVFLDVSLYTEDSNILFPNFKVKR